VADNPAPIEAQIQEVQDDLARLLALIAPLREDARLIAAGLEEVGREYHQRLTTLVTETNRLEDKKAILNALLRGNAPRPVVTTTPQPTTTPPPTTTLPPELVNRGTQTNNSPDSEFVLKRRLVDHILSFTDDLDVKVQINVILADGQRTVADILEIMPPGELWTSVAGWETPAKQLERVSGWRTALKERQEYWQRQIDELKFDRSYPLLTKKRAGTEAEWHAYLDELARDYEAVNRRLAHEIEVLQAELDRRQAGA
jgi:hypothetical protein